jgi:hypothetical protein
MIKTSALAVTLAFVAGLSPVPARAQNVNSGPAVGAGWILWEKNMVTRAGRQRTTWEPLDGFESLADCRTTAQPVLQAAVDYMPTTGAKMLGPVRPDGRSAMFTLTKGGVQETTDLRYLCFPGAFDPRPQPVAGSRR